MLLRDLLAAGPSLDPLQPHALSSGRAARRGELTGEARALLELLCGGGRLDAPAAAEQLNLSTAHATQLFEELHLCGLAFPDQGNWIDENRAFDLSPAASSEPVATWDRGEAAEPVGPATVDERLKALYGMIHILNTSEDPETLLNRILDMALDVVRAERGLILLRNEEDDWDVEAARNLEKQTIDDARAFSSSIVRAAGKGQAILAADDERLQQMKSTSLYGIQSVLCVPLRHRSENIGAVYLESRAGGALFTRDDLQFLEAFADHAALALENARRDRQLRATAATLRAAAADRVHFGNIVAHSASMRRVCDQIARLAQGELSVVIQGDSGTGKELVARALHFNGPRRSEHFLSVNSAAIPESLLESELFGHTRGGFTGAIRDRAGMFELADGGTLFLDEVGDMSPRMQAQLLRVLQEGEVRRVQGDHTIQVDVRVIAATHRDLDQMVREGSFREDLLYRLRVGSIVIPPLRERREDIPVLVDHLLGNLVRSQGRQPLRVAPEVLEALVAKDWPGNVRQLENVLQRLALFADGDTIGPELLGDELDLLDPAANRRSGAPASRQRTIVEDEELRIREALELCEGNVAKAGAMLGIPHATMYRKLKRYGIRRKDYKPKAP